MPLDMWDLSSLTRDQTWAPSVKTQSYSLDHQGIPPEILIYLIDNFNCEIVESGIFLDSLYLGYNGSSSTPVHSPLITFVFDLMVPGGVSGK